MIRRLFLLAIATSFVLASGACRSDIEPIALAPSGPWVASDYTLLVESSHAEAQAGETVTIAARLLDPEGSDVSESFDISRHITPPLGVLVDGADQYRFTEIEVYTYIASVSVLGATLVSSTEVDVVGGAPVNLKIHVSPPLVAAGSPVTLFSEITDAYGNPASGTVDYQVNPSATVSGDLVTATASGTYTVTGTLVGTDAVDTDTFSVEAAAPASLTISLSSYDVERGDGVFVETVVLDGFGNPSEHEVDLWTDGTGTIVWADYVRFEDEGLFTVFAEIPEYGLSDQDGPVLVDSTGPQIRVTTPSRGVEIPATDGPTVTLSGSVIDPRTGESSVTINGDPANLLAGGLFSYPMVPEEGLNELNIVAVDGDGNVSDHFQTFLWGDFQPVGQPHDDGILARLNEGAIDVLEDMIETEVPSGALTAGLVGNLYTSPQWCIGVGWLVQVCGQVLIDLNSVSMSAINMDLDPHAPNSQFSNGFLAFDMEVTDFNIDLGLTGIFSGTCCFGLVTWSESLNAGADIGVGWLDLESDVNLFVNAANEIQVQMANTTTDIDDLDIDIYGLGIFGDLLGGLTTFMLNLFEPILEGLLPPIIESALPGALEDALGDMDIAMTMDLMGASLDVEALPGFIECDDDGITISLDSSAVATLGPNPPATIGSWYRTTPIPSYGSSPDFELSLADKFVNQLMHAVWQAGVIDFSMDATELGLDFTALEDFLPLTNLSIETLPLLPPVVGPSNTGLLELSLGDMIINVYGDPGGNQGLMMQLAVSLWADADLSIDSAGLIQFGLGDPVVVMDYVTSDWAELNGEVAEDLMDSIVDLMVPQITSALDDIGGIPIPELPGFGLASPSVEREPVPVDYISVGGGLELLP